MTRIALYPGSFDPPTRGHEDLIRRSRELADRVVVAVAVNSGCFAALTATATTTPSARSRLRRMRSSWPRVGGSKEPG